MKIFFNGSTLISGELHKSFANEYDAEFLNLANTKYCNHAIWRTTLEESPVNYDLAIIEFTKPSKMEYFNGREWVDFISNERISKYWYENIYTEEFGACDENFAVEALRDYFTINNTASIIISTDKNTKSDKFDIVIDSKDKNALELIKNYYETFIRRR